MKLCVPIKETKIKDVVFWLRKAEKEADIIEVWFDEITDSIKDVARQIALVSNKPLLYKVSKFNIKKIEFLLNEIRNIEYLDLDLSTDKNIIKKIKTKFPKIQLIISHHDFKKTPSQKELQTIVEIMFTKGADIAKVATTASKMEDSLNILSLLSKLSHDGKKAICLCMGKKGRLTRITGHLLGNYLMYAPMGEAHKTAPGQLTIQELKKYLI